MFGHCRKAGLWSCLLDRDPIWRVLERFVTSGTAKDIHHFLLLETLRRFGHCHVAGVVLSAASAGTGLARFGDLKLAVKVVHHVLQLETLNRFF